MKTNKIKGNQKANNAVMDLCPGTKIAFNPLRMLHTEEVEEEIVHDVIDSDFGELNKRLNNGEGSEDTTIRLRETERETWFLAGIMFGKRQSDRSIRKAVKLVSG